MISFARFAFAEKGIIMHLYHYYEKKRGPFLTVMDLPRDDAVKVFQSVEYGDLPRLPDIEWFLTRRSELENTVRELFIQKGGKPERKHPHYMTIGTADCFLAPKSWYIEPEFLRIDIGEFDLSTVSFTYGDMFPVFNPNLDKGEEYRNSVYTFDEITKLIEKYGYPQDWEGVARTQIQRMLKYVEAHIWSDGVVGRCRGAWLADNAGCV